MKAEHTPPPYEITRVNADELWITHEQNKLASIIYPLSERIEMEATAEFIIRACNNHARLVEACKEATAGLQIALANLNRGVSSTTIGQLNKIRYDVETIVAKVEK
ncbi:hypothetical protein LCGC14_1721120 [marine sediment metagenome]|uniref:Uncharacterized protein n=1 Tax=marine sediment metagenome TaxID=412755 RepID=A0A0F9JSU5_9ZZZZ